MALRSKKSSAPPETNEDGSPVALDDATRAAAAIPAQVFAKAASLWPSYELRPQQVTMCNAVMETLQGNKSIIIEAPTGVGKTLAYLIPAVIESIRSGRKAIISTHTKNLQDQLFQKDIPLVRELLDVPFSCILLKGRRNYLCTTRLHHALSSATSLFTSAEQTELESIRLWAENATDGDIESLGFTPSSLVWNMISSEPGLCNPHSCQSGCFYQRLWEHARTANVVVMNHSLFFTMLARQEKDDRLIFGNDFVVFDEAHTIENVASACLGVRCSRNHLLGLVQRVHNPKTRKGLAGRRTSALKDLCLSSAQRIRTFYEDLLRAASSASPVTAGKELRIRTAHLVPDTLNPALERLCAELDNAAASGTTPFEQELKAIAANLETTGASVAQFLTQSTSSSAYWIETGRGPDPDVTLCISPFDVSGLLGPRLFAGSTSVVLTSATLSVNESAAFFQQRLGAQDLPFLKLDSPFQHSRQMRLCLAAEMPDPDSAAYAPALNRGILHAITRTQGRALVLFTNAKVMREAALALGDELRTQGIQLLVQGTNQTRHGLLMEFKKDIHSVLFGLDSFWSGVDVPGEALEHVIVTKLPFAVPNHPLIEAKLEAITMNGGNAFTDFTLPEAVLKFRQGVGRLIRSTSDRGLVTVLDPRIVRKSYGRIFVQSLPQCPVEIQTPEGEVRDLEEPFF